MLRRFVPRESHFWLIAVLVFCCALLFRSYRLAAFLAIDEWLWLDRSRNFSQALADRDWSHTFQTGHPGVTTMWLGTVGLWAYGLRHSLMQSGAFSAFLGSLNWANQPLELFPYLQAGIALLTSLSVTAIFLLMNRLSNTRIALVAALLLAFDPWSVGHSRVLYHDGLMATFMTLSALSLLVYIERSRTTRALHFSAGCAGLALLSKTLSLFLLPWTGIVLLLAYRRGRLTLSQSISGGLIWLIGAALTFCMLWPAMWVQPVETVTRMIQMLAVYGTNPHERGQFFMGVSVPDPGPLFYPTILLYAATPVLLLGIALLAIRAWRRQGEVYSSFLTPAFIYTVGYLIMVSFGEKKHERYLLPALLMLNCIAAVGIDWGIVSVRRWLQQIMAMEGRGVTTGLIGAVVIAQIALLVPHSPYYFSYYNPLLGGQEAASHRLLVGRGEGNELAAALLDDLPDAADVRVIASLPATFAPFFTGVTMPWQIGADLPEADYATIYHRDIQQEVLELTAMGRVMRTWSLFQTIHVNGVPYVYIYRNPESQMAQEVKPEVKDLDNRASH